MSLVKYCKNESCRLLRLIKRSVIASYYKVKRDSNTVDILSYKKKVYVRATSINEYQYGNAYYGISHVLCEYAGYKGIICANIEHGVFLGDITDGELLKYDMPCVFTFSNERKKTIRKVTSKPIFAIGPYILYAKDILDLANFNRIKDKLGKVLLVMPSHGLEQMGVDYSLDQFIDKIKYVKNELQADSVLVCLYFSDIDRYRIYYEKEGYMVVCAGYRTDSDFLERQRLYISLADYVLTNGVGTHIGYAVALNTPVSYFEQHISYEFEREETNEHVAPALGTQFENNRKAEIIQAFSGMHLSIADAQRTVVNKYWGLNSVKSKDEMRLLMEQAAKVWKKSKFSNSNYKDLFDKVYYNS